MIEKIDASPESIQKTGKAFLIAGCFFGVILFFGESHISGWTHWDWNAGLDARLWKWFLGMGLGLFTMGYTAYPVMKPIHIGWMTLALVLGWVNTRLLLGAFYYLIVTPVGLAMRLLGKDILNEKINRSAATYWITRKPAPIDQKRYEHLF